MGMVEAGQRVSLCETRVQSRPLNCKFAFCGVIGYDVCATTAHNGPELPSQRADLGTKSTRHVCIVRPLS